MIMRNQKRSKAEKGTNAETLVNSCSTSRVSITLRRLSVTKADKPIESNGRVLLDDVQKWQQEIYVHLKKANHVDVVQDCNRIFIITNVYFLINRASSFVKSLFVIGAPGVMASPTVFFPNNELAPINIFDTDNTNESPIDNTTNDNLLSYIQCIFHPWLTLRGNKFPVIIFIDIDPVHVSRSVLSFCTKNQIILLSTTPALSLHPIKSFVQQLLKNAWTTELNSWNKKNKNQQIPIESVPPIQRQVFDKTITVSILSSLRAYVIT